MNLDEEKKKATIVDYDMTNLADYMGDKCPELDSKETITSYSNALNKKMLELNEPEFCTFILQNIL